MYPSRGDDMEDSVLPREWVSMSNSPLPSAGLFLSKKELSCCKASPSSPLLGYLSQLWHLVLFRLCCSTPSSSVEIIFLIKENLIMIFSFTTSAKNFTLLSYSDNIFIGIALHLYLSPLKKGHFYYFKCFPKV